MSKFKPLLLASLLCSAPLTYAKQIDVKALSQYAGVSCEDIQEALSQSVYQQKIIDAITRPGEAKPWWQYRKIFITTSRIQAAVNFYFENENILKRAESTYGVPSEIICAIIGVETFFGRNMGSWRVLDALYTLGFNYPKREAYFSKEFARFVALAKKENWSYDSVKGSYAGAMGMGQFMPSSYLDYAVDFDSDGKIDLFYSKADAIGSVANYFKEHGWQTGRGICYPVHINRASPEDLMKKQWELTVDELYKSGASTKVNLSYDQSIRLFSYDLENGKKGYVVGLDNFRSIMRYNTSPLYARAVFELSEHLAMNIDKIKAKRGLKVDKRSKKP
ncbi:MAG: lytic murein transglycosylase B [Succinivibrio sp.]